MLVVKSPSWNSIMIDELEAFPAGEHDDVVDSLAGGFNWLGKGQKMNLKDWLTI